MQHLNIMHANGSYPIIIGNNLLSQPDALRSYLPNHDICIITDKTVAKHYLTRVQELFADLTQHHVILPPGESQKNLSVFERIIDSLITHQCSRDTTLIALGGGVITDLTGFVAASYFRGINLIQIPTTLLAQVDASIGGKTAVNHPKGKNLIGAFHQPQAVLIDLQTLSTLPDREFRSGIAEIIKAALIFDASFFTWIENHIADLLSRDTEALTIAIKRACEIKQHFVESDERDYHQRHHLNFGHTFGHAIEKTLGFGTWLHGEAVAYGIVMAAYLSQASTGLPSNEYKRIITLLRRAGILKKIIKINALDELTQAMRSDKKIKHGRLQFVLLKQIGQSTITDQLSDNMIQSAWHDVNRVL